MSPSDRVRARNVRNQLRLIAEHLEAIQRDVYGLEFQPWKQEIDVLWRSMFEQISKMSTGPQKSSLEAIKEPWTTYLKHYAATQ